MGSCLMNIVSVLQDEKTLGAGCTIQICLTLVNCSLKSS